MCYKQNMIEGYQLRAARALVGMSLKDLSGRVGIGQPAISAFENGQSEPYTRTIRKLQEALEMAGVEFTATGAQMRTTPFYLLKGEGWYLDLLDDVYDTLMDTPNAEVLIDGVDDSKSSPPVVEKIRKLRNAGIKMRMLSEEGNTYLSGRVEEYRAIPKEYFENWITMIYGDKIAISVDNETGATIIRDKGMANAYKDRFNLLWSILPTPAKSTADVRY